MYQKVSTNLNFVEREKNVEKFWKENQIFEKLKEILSNIKPKLDLSRVGMEDSLVNDLRIDSLTMLMLSLAVEKEFAINVNAGERFVTVRDVVEYVGRDR